MNERPFGNIWKGKVAPQLRGRSIIHGLLTPYHLPPSFHPPKNDVVISCFGFSAICQIPQLLQGMGQRISRKEKSPPSEARGVFMDFFVWSQSCRERIFLLFSKRWVFSQKLTFCRNSLKTSWNPTRVNEPLFRRGVFLDPQNDATFEGFLEGSNFYFPLRKIQQCL